MRVSVMDRDVPCIPRTSALPTSSRRNCFSRFIVDVSGLRRLRSRINYLPVARIEPHRRGEAFPLFPRPLGEHFNPVPIDPAFYGFRRWQAYGYEPEQTAQKAAAGSCTLPVCSL